MASARTSDPFIIILRFLFGCFWWCVRKIFGSNIFIISFVFRFIYGLVLFFLRLRWLRKLAKWGAGGYLIYLGVMYILGSFLIFVVPVFGVVYFYLWCVERFKVACDDAGIVSQSRKRKPPRLWWWWRGEYWKFVEIFLFVVIVYEALRLVWFGFQWFSGLFLCFW